VRPDGSTGTKLNSQYKYIMKNIDILNNVFYFYQTNNLFNKHDTKMFYKSLFPHFKTPQKTELCIELAKYFHKIKEHVADRWYLYDDFELAFFYGILGNFEYSRMDVYNKLFFSKLRRKIAIVKDSA
jgi:hypothetical protein